MNKIIPTERDYRDIALRMALRHPDVMDMIGNPNYYELREKRYLSEQEANYLYQNFGISTNTISVHENGTEFEEYDLSEARICHLPIQEKIGNSEIKTFKESNILQLSLPTKLTLTDALKGGVLIKTILQKDSNGYTLFDWYDAFHKISKKKPYDLDKTKSLNNKAKKDCKILYEWIMQKRWFDLVP
ncbi:hypothetical protein [Sulfurospirillum cavolei]|uniref:hypothetical protein n=1 Tax=Sulfurospirillum cavolei TaxID=366522 RepID=UPI0005A7BEB9|nr:hypothetical protein [Sulfurospirillum cavolei]